MAHILVNDPLDDRAVALLLEAGHEIDSRRATQGEIESGILARYDAVIIRSMTKLSANSIELGAKGSLKVIARAGVGTDNVDLQAATKANVIVVNAPAASSEAVAELALGLLLSCARHICDGDRSMRSGEWAKKRLSGHEIRGKKLGLVGYGRIAREVAARARSFGMEIHTFDPYINKDEICEEVTFHPSIKSLFEVCSHISVHCMLTDETYHLVNSDVLKMMGGGPNVLVNCARGGIIDENAAFKALERGILSACALDVFEDEPIDTEHPLLTHPNFIGTPHIGAATIEAQQRVAAQTAQNLLSALEGNPSFGWVNRQK